MQVFINTYGTSLRIQEGILSIKHEEKINKVPLAKLKTLYISKSILISTDVLYECIHMGIDVVLTERNGHPIGRVWNNKFGSISTIRKDQLDFSKSPQVSTWVICQLAEKIENQKELLLCFLSMDEPYTQEIHKAIEQLSGIQEKLRQNDDGPIEEIGPRLRALEGQAAKLYFQCINKHLPFAYQFERRSRHPALDMINAMLNYAYGILYSHIESALIKAGLDPFIGFFHRDDYNRPVLTYDVIEPYRPWADWVVIHLCLNEAVHEDGFEIDQGGYWLMGDAKRLLIQHFADFFDEVIPYGGKRLTRLNHLERIAFELVNQISTKNKKNP